METLLVTLKNDKARKLLEDLQDLELIDLAPVAVSNKKISGAKISDLKTRVFSPMAENVINEQLDQIRNEWQRGI